jgi:hypothetical protein
MWNKCLAAGAAALAIATLPTVASAAQVVLIENPSKWRLQDYIPGGGVTVFFSSSGCANGVLVLPSTVQADEQNRWWSLVLTAKTAGTLVGVVFDNSTCVISSFFAPP